MNDFYARPLIITVAPNGAYKQAVDHPALPLTTQSLAQTAKQCLEAGAAMLHLHIRDAQGRHSLDLQGYQDAIAAVRAAVGQEMVLQVTRALLQYSKYQVMPPVVRGKLQG